MGLRSILIRRGHHGRVLGACTLAALLTMGGASGQETKLEFLHIGSSGSFTGATQPGKEKAALETLQAFIKEETGLDNEIKRQKDWRELAAKLTKGELQIGVFQGYEFAWVQE